MVEASAQGYRWGRFQGWATLGLGVLLYLIAPFNHSGEMRAILYVSGAFNIFAGVGLLRKKRYGFVLIYLLVAHTALVALISMGGVQWGLFLWWAIPASWYYPKRYKDFGFGRGREQVAATESAEPRAAEVAQAGVVSSGGEDAGIRRVGEEEWREAVARHRVKLMENERNGKQ
jgi:hypothetical protein